MATESVGPARKKAKQDASLNGNGGINASKKSKSSLNEMESFPTGIGTKSKPCTKFFSTAGCPFGEGCHFLHYVPGGLSVVAQMMNLNNGVAASTRKQSGPGMSEVASPGVIVKTRICNKYNTAEGCKFGDQCHFAHGERELGKPIAPGSDHQFGSGVGSRLAGRLEPSVPPAASFGASATAKISVDASLAGAIIGKGGVNSKQICRVTGAKLSIRDHESDPNLRNIELEGTFDQIKHASTMVRELIVSVSAAGGAKNSGPPGSAAPGPGSNYKTKLCENYGKGSCTFGDRCHFAHGASELRKP
ncbi:zinc finger CCCH domain-containing protein 31-like [Nymphaea colorata]|nr:zinc finger CCCH domain-containing protein 31-like [Nymphaea colorata]